MNLSNMKFNGNMYKELNRRKNIPVHREAVANLETRYQFLLLNL